MIRTISKLVDDPRDPPRFRRHITLTYYAAPWLDPEQVDALKRVQDAHLKKSELPAL